MKTLLAMSLLMIGSISFASTEACQEAAQLKAKVVAVTDHSVMGCTIQVSGPSVELYLPSQVCPLSLEDIVTTGISVGLSNGHDCQLDVGSEINDILVKTADGAIVIDGN